MKFLILTQFYPPEIGAAQTRLSELTRELKNNHHDVEVLTALPNYPFGQIFADYRSRFYSTEMLEGAPVHRFWLFASQGKSISRIANYLSFSMTCILGIFVCTKPDYIFVNSGPLFLSMPARFLSLIWQRPIIFNVADLWPRSISALNATTGTGFLLKFALALEAWSYRKAKYVTAVTQGIFDILRDEKKINPAKILFMPNGVNATLYTPAIDSQKKLTLKKTLGLENKFVYIYSGNHGYAHALENVLHAAKLLEDESKLNPNFTKIHILMVGDGSDKSRLLKIKQNLNLNNISFLPPVTQEELVDYLDFSDVGLIHIKNSDLAAETRPAKMFPMMAMQKPILFAGFGEGANIIKSASGGIVVPPEDPVLLKNALIHFFTHPEDNLKFGENNRAYVLQNLLFSNIIKSWLEQLHQADLADKN